jgi:hypothetical protein
MTDDIPDEVVGVYFEVWTPCEYPESNLVDEDGYRCTFTNSRVFLNRDSNPEEFTEEKVAERRKKTFKIKNHTWLYPEDDFNRETGEKK